MSEWSRNIAMRFGEIESDRRLKDQIKMHDAGLLSNEGAALWEEYSETLDRKAAELNKESAMRGVCVRVDRNINTANQLALRSFQHPKEVKVRYDHKLYTINFTPAEEGRYQMRVEQGANHVSIFDPKGNRLTVEELAEKTLAYYLEV